MSGAAEGPDPGNVRAWCAWVANERRDRLIRWIMRTTRVTDPADAADVLQDTSGWEELNRAGLRIGPEDVSFTVTAFMDFTCPYCRDLAPVLDSVLDALGPEGALVLHHFPLTGSQQSVPSAIAAECADKQGRFRDMYSILYRQMDSIGEKSWSSFAAEAGVPDVPDFERCLEAPLASFREHPEYPALEGGSE